MADDAAFIWDQPTPRPTAPRRAAAAADSESGRITVREAEHRFGVSAATLRNWARDSSIDAIRTKGSHGDQWMLTPESVAHRLSRRTKKPARTSTPGRTDGRQPRPSTGLSIDGTSMLVPRDAWDKLMDQLGNLHEAGMQLAEARERAARAETEASFLRERMAEMRSERDELKQAGVSPGDGPTADRPSRRWWQRSRTT